MGKTDAYNEIMALIRERMRMCDEWRERVRMEHAGGVISTEESLRQMRLIGDEMSKTDDMLKRMDDYLRSLKII